MAPHRSEQATLSRDVQHSTHEKVNLGATSMINLTSMKLPRHEIYTPRYSKSITVANEQYKM